MVKKQTGWQKLVSQLPVCDICGKTVFESYMLKDSVWRQVLRADDQNAWKHFGCAERRLGRKFKITDFRKDNPMNRMLFRGYNMRKR